MSKRFQYVGQLATDWLTPEECKGAQSDVQLWRVRDALSVVLQNGRVITIERGFVTDFASVPPVAQWYVGTENPLVNRPAAFHDRNYTEKDIPREEADELFYQMLLDEGMRPSQAWVLYRAVRLFGGKRWNS